MRIQCRTTAVLLALIFMARNWERALAQKNIAGTAGPIGVIYTRAGQIETVITISALD